MIHHLAAEAVARRASAQQYEELVIAGLILNEAPPASVLEIGTASGGTLWFWSKIATSHARIASIDVSHHDLHADFEVGQHQELLMHLGDSRDSSSMQAVTEFFDGTIDFLFIDGDHSYAVADWDWSVYGPLVRSGGWVGFHDIEGPYVADGGSWKVWQEVKALVPARPRRDTATPRGRHGNRYGEGMSADNYAVCPACVAREVGAVAAEHRLVAALYGSVPLEEFLTRQRAAAEMEVDADSAEYRTFREDYEVYADEGEVIVSYSGHCSECGLGTDFTYKKRFWEPGGGPPQ